MAELRFHFDESIPMPDAIAGALRRAGIDVTTTQDAGLRMTDDAAQLAFVRESRRIIVTCDSDFLKIASDEAAHLGIVFYAQQSRHVGHVIEWLLLMYGVLDASDMQGKVEFI